MPSHNHTHVPGLLKGELPTDKESDIVQLSEDNNDVAVDIKPKQELKQEVKCFVAGTVQKLVTGAKKTLVQKKIKLKCQNSASISTQSSAVSTTTTTTVPPLEKRQSTLNIHILAQDPEYQFPCTVCGKSYVLYNSWY